MQRPTMPRHQVSLVFVGRADHLADELLLLARGRVTKKLRKLVPDSFSAKKCRNKLPHEIIVIKSSSLYQCVLDPRKQIQ